MFFVAAALLGVAFGALELSPDNFDAEALGSKNSFVKFFAPWCGHCKKMKPDWDKLSDMYAGSSSVVVADVDCTVHQDLCGRFDVRGYPTIKYFTATTGEKGEAYNGGRDFDSFKTFVEENLAAKCSIEDQSGCSEKEKDYITKMKAKSSDDVKGEKDRLNKMKAGSMKPELKAWLVQRIAILEQL